MSSRLLSLSLSASRAAAVARQSTPATARTLATVSSVQDVAPRNHKVVIVGAGSAGLSISHQLLRTGKFRQDDIAIVDPAQWHHYQPGWTLVGGGLKHKDELKRPLPELTDPKLKLYNNAVETFAPHDNTVTLADGARLTYDQLVVVPGIKVDLAAIKGLQEAATNPDSNVSCIYTYETVDKVFPTIKRFKQGRAIFTQPTGVVKCAGAPQKIMWLALDHWKREGRYKPSASDSPITITFATGLPQMFGVAKYSKALEELRKERGVEGLFAHDLTEIDGNTAVFKSASGDVVRRTFDLMHVVPKMGAHAFVKNSPLANEAGFVDVDDHTLRHKKYANVWSAGDASSLPTSKTAAAITSQAPILVKNLVAALDGREPPARYDGYTSCPLLTEYGKVMLAEFKYGGEPKETFGQYGFDQATPRRAFYHLKKDFFPWVYYKAMVKGMWGGPKGFLINTN
ncbi:uncharacterized protein CTHT_0049480 [Thermochaetoides thermophila DSM 1495]|uniref:FAD/NAD(P)-binding domain-containing protein n=1 Tax=Chaetomium thermophilum (strain DSM 1495 / CBS 144.50 / IMI 039719) TaxID=759272 RepID=G0SBA1_CHATD|nr:hypothetical protein CTHT_0049480 [Thermochaetoides thermophila DSM 1495]EGS19481.1 hypothetical protein CTHT_0049480 [Thermochaetoides thermophila DSM 1495]